MKAPRLSSGALGQPEQWNALHDDASGSAALLAHQQLGYYTLATTPSNGQVINFIVNGTTIPLTGVTAIGSTPGNFLIVAGNPNATLQNALNLLQNPWTTNSTQVALTLANQELLAYVGVALSGTTLTAYSLNTTLNGQLTSFSGSTTFTNGSFTAQTMQLYVEPGTIYINGTQVKFLGGSTPTVTAPISNPRIDILTINSSGTLAWTTGTENASPTVPAYPTYTLIVLCELYNVVGETSLYDLANQQNGQGYIQYDSRSFPSIVTNFSAISQDFLPDATATRSLGSPSKQFLNIYAGNIYSGSAAVAFSKFGGTGADGALTITSGVTTISFGGGNYLEKNYTSVNIAAAGGGINFSNTSSNGGVFAMKTTGNFTFTAGEIAGDGSGAAAGNDGFGLTKGPKTPISVSGICFPSGTGSAIPSWYVMGGSGVGAVPGPYSRFSVFSGAGGGTAPSGNSANNAGAAGAGGLGILIECGGYLNFTATISSVGSAGSNGSGSTSWSGGCAAAAGGGSNSSSSSQVGQFQTSGGTGTFGGGGGGGGSVVIFYNFLTANTGTITVTGGAGGTGTKIAGNAGANGFSYVGLNEIYV